MIKKQKLGTKTLLVILICTTCAFTQISCRSTRIATSKETVLSGTIQNYHKTNFSLTYDIYSLLKSTQKEIVEIDSNGHFNIHLQINSPITGTLNFGRDMMEGRGVNKLIFTYIEPGDSIHIAANVDVLSDLDIIQKTLVFTGTGINNNEFVNRVDNKFDSYKQKRENNSDFIKNLQPDQYIRTVDSIKDLKLRYLAAYADSSKISSKLKEIYKLDFEDMAVIRKFNYPTTHQYFNDGKGAVLPSGYYDFADKVKIVTDLEDKGLPYLRYANFFLRNKFELEQQKGYKGNYITFLNTELQDRAKYIYMAYSLGGDFNPEIYAKFGKDCPYADIAKIVKDKYSHLENMLPGHPAPQVVFTNMGNENISSTEFFKNKYVYIDFWATWCKPCVREIPFLDTLKEEYKGKNIQFVSVSFDVTKTPWEKYVKKNELTGTQFWVDGPNRKIYDDGFNITMIPRFVLIDTNGKIIDANAPRPSSGKDIRGLLNKALENRAQ